MRTPKTLFELLGQKCEKDRIDDAFEIWGKYARMFQIAPQMVEYESEGEKRSSAQFYRGWLKEAENYKELLQIEYTLSNLSCIVVLFQVGGMNRSIMQTWRTSLIM